MDDIEMDDFLKEFNIDKEISAQKKLNRHKATTQIAAASDSIDSNYSVIARAVAGSAAGCSTAASYDFHNIAATSVAAGYLVADGHVAAGPVAARVLYMREATSRRDF